MTGSQGLLAARAGLGLNGLLGVLLAGLLLLTAPVMILEGEELGAIVLGVVWGAFIGLLAVLALGFAATLERSTSRIGARAVVIVQLVTMFCFCGVLPLFGTLAVWLGLLVADRERG